MVVPVAGPTFPSAGPFLSYFSLPRGPLPLSPVRPLLPLCRGPVPSVSAAGLRRARSQSLANGAASSGSSPQQTSPSSRPRISPLPQPLSPDFLPRTSPLEHINRSRYPPLAIFIPVEYPELRARVWGILAAATGGPCAILCHRRELERQTVLGDRRLLLRVLDDSSGKAGN